MKKHSILAMAMAMGLAGSITLPAEAAAVYRIGGNGQSKGCIIVKGQICNLPEVKSTLQDLCEKLQNGNWAECPTVTLPDCNQTSGQGKPIVPEEGKPDVPEMGVPEEDQPDAPETDIPVENVPEEENSGGNIPEIEQPGDDNTQLSYAEQIVKLVNAERAKAGLHAVTLDNEIAAAAQVRAKEITTSFSHTRPDGRKFSTVLTDNGIRFSGAGENIAWGQKSPEQVMEAWMNSDGHRANILSAKFTKIGVGHYQDSVGRNYWVQLFTY